MKYREFVKQIWDAVEECPNNWRKGQKVFNVMEALYGDVARQVQFINHVDCFYDDKQIEPFIDQCWIRVFSKEHPIPLREDGPPEVDLEKELQAFLCNYDYEFDDDDPVPFDIARHFYELGQCEMRNRISNPEYNKQVVDKMKSEYPELGKKGGNK